MPKAAAPARVIFDEAEAIAAMSVDDWVALDLETGGLSPYRDPLAVVALARRDGVAAVIHCKGHLSERLAAWLGDPARKFVGHNVIGFDECFLAANGVNVWGPSWYDTMLGELVTLASGRRDVKVNLKAAVKRRLGKELDKSIDHGSWMRDDLTEEALAYVTGDVRYIHGLMAAQAKVAAETGTQRAIDVEMGAGPTFVRMSYNGIPVDVPALRAYIAGLQGQASGLRAQLDGFFGPINLNSPLQVKTALKERRGLDLLSTRREELALAQGISQDEALGALLEFRHVNQRIKVYTDEWVRTNVIGGRVHPKYWQCGTDTGRCSCSEPNAQQFPRDMRHVFGNVPGHTFISCDYSQIEVRVAADLSGDEALLAALASGDIHRGIASQVFGKPAEAISKAERKLAKALSFCLLFGGGAERLWRYARVNGSELTKDEALRLRTTFFANFTGLAAFHEHARRKARYESTVLTFPTGMRRVLAGELNRQTIILNNIVQGTAAAGLKHALIECRATAGIAPYLIGTVHDEILALAPDAEAEAVGEALQAAMLRGMGRVCDAPVLAELTLARTWAGPEYDAKRGRA